MGCRRIHRGHVEQLPRVCQGPKVKTRNPESWIYPGVFEGSHVLPTHLWGPRLQPPIASPKQPEKRHTKKLSELQKSTAKADRNVLQTMPDKGHRSQVVARVYPVGYAKVRVVRVPSKEAGPRQLVAQDAAEFDVLSKRLLQGVCWDILAALHPSP